jgi:hypothetical protein
MREEVPSAGLRIGLEVAQDAKKALPRNAAHNDGGPKPDVILCILTPAASARPAITGDAPKPDVRGRGVDRLRVARGRAITAAVVGCAKVRAAL